MTGNTSTARSHADVTTDRPERYGKQLVSHLGRRNGGEWSAGQKSGWIDLGDGRATVTAGDSKLKLDVVAPAEHLARLEGVLGGPLVRFGERDELTVQWTRSESAK